MKKLDAWLSANHTNFNVGYYSLLGLALIGIGLPTLPFMNPIVQMIAIMAIYVIVAMSYIKKYHNDEWHEND